MFFHIILNLNLQLRREGVLKSYRFLLVRSVCEILKEFFIKSSNCRVIKNLTLMVGQSQVGEKKTV